MTTLNDVLDSFRTALRSVYDFDVPPHTTQADVDASKKLLADCETFMNVACTIAEQIAHNRSDSDGAHIFAPIH